MDKDPDGQVPREMLFMSGLFNTIFVVSIVHVYTKGILYIPPLDVLLFFAFIHETIVNLIWLFFFF